ncbi:MAG: hypothetical protein EBX56_02835, partial [Betaproteobacteria bacterium]|nr:hypothetical protein [Betaproteobacteria bacterium]
MPEDDGVVRRLPPLLRYRDQWHASLSLAVLACMGLVPEKASITPRWPAGQMLSTGVLDLASDAQGLWSIPYARSNRAWLSVPAYLAYESAEPAPQPPPAQASKAPFGEGPKDLTFL